MYVDGFHYGPYLQHALSQCERQGSGDDATPTLPPQMPLTATADGAATPACLVTTPGVDGTPSSGSEKGSYVVYRQTVDLVNMLEKNTIVEQS